MKKNKKYILKIAGWCLLSILLLILAAGIYVFSATENYLNKNLSKWVDNKSNHLYQLSFKNIDIQYQPLSISFTEVSLTTDTITANRILKESPGKILYNFYSPKIKISNIKLISFLKEQSFRCKNISIVKPELKLSGADFLQIDSTKTFDDIFTAMQPLFGNRLKQITIDEINFVDANYNIYSSSAHFKPISNAKQISVTVKKFSTDSSLIFNAAQFFDSEDILIEMIDSRNNLGDSIHVLTIDTLIYSLKTSDIFASGFHLFHTTKNNDKNLFDVFVPKLHLKSNSLTRFPIEDSIDIQSLTFDNPQLKYYQKENPAKFDIETINQFNLYSLIESQFTNIDIDSFVLNNANLEIYKQPDYEYSQQQYESINISLFGFELDSTSAKNQAKIFHADDLEMLIHNYHLSLEDNQHEFNSDSLFVSTLSNTLGTKNILISPLNKNNEKSRTQVNVSCKDLHLENVNLKTLFHTRTLPTQLIQITEPHVQIQYHTEIQQTKEQLETGLLFNLVTAYSKGVYAEVVQIENGKLNIRHLYNNKEQGYFETSFNFLLSGFALDSESMKRTDKFFFATNFDLQFAGYQMKLVDNLHKINVENISILSSDRKLQINNLRLEPIIKDADLSVMQAYERSELFKIFIPKITMLGINLRDAFFYNKLNMLNFEVTEPEIYFENFSTLRQTKEKIEFTEIYQLIFNYITDLNIGKITIPDGKFTWVNHTKNGKTTSFDNGFSATLENFRMNEGEIKKQRLLFSDNFNISLKDQVFQLSDSVHILQAGKINLSTATSTVSIENAFLYPEIKSKNYPGLSTTFQASIPNLQISNVDFLKAWYSKELRLDKLVLTGPKFRVFSKKGISKSLDLNKFQFPLPSILTSLQLNEFIIENGQVITYEISGTKQVAKSNFNIDLSVPKVSIKNNEEKQIHVSTQNLIAKISNFTTTIGKNHEMGIDQLDFNRQEKTASVLKLKVTPVKQNNGGNEFFINAPNIKLTDFDVNLALEKNYFKFNEILISNPKISIEIADSVKGDKFEFAKNLDLYPYIKPYVDMVEINQLQLSDVDIDFNWFEKILINRRFNLNFKEIYIAENRKIENLLHAKEFEISTTNLSTTSKNGLYEFTADSLIYNSEKHNTLLKNIKINPLLSPDEFNKKNKFQTEYINGTSQFIELKGVNESLWLQENVLDAKALIIGKTNLEIFRNKRLPFDENQRPPWPQDLIKELDQPFVFGSVELLPSFLKYSELLDISDERGYITFNNLTLKTGKITNIEKYVKQNPMLQINASSKIMNSGLLSAKFNFDMTAKNYAHTVIGDLQTMPLNAFNAIIEKSVPMSIETGQLNRFEFNLTLDNKLAVGELYFAYQDLNVSIFNLENPEAKKSKLASFWANKMVLNSKNPKGDELLPVYISYERDVQRSIINYWWKAIFSGSKESIGIKPEK